MVDIVMDNRIPPGSIMISFCMNPIRKYLPAYPEIALLGIAPFCADATTEQLNMTSKNRVHFLRKVICDGESFTRD